MLTSTPEPWMFCVVQVGKSGGQVDNDATLSFEHDTRNLTNNNRDNRSSLIGIPQGAVMPF